LPTRSGPSIALTVRAANVLDQPYQTIIGYKTPGRQLLGGVRISY
jgi:outer membrane cobalamin receptor